ncbi:MAG: exodeoxyribonuclease VII small subunit [Myxococcaceae bacterium]|nr:exodeoxyribonuclease VII small subunit [Myxococcaceae bacterium]MCI0668963.1 exodeoxyribonuclease VII small subunit [Myxococcaceae bacterium]
MAKEAKARESYGEVVQRLEEVVRRLEGGELALEDSLKAFEEGIGLVRRGERLLDDAEKRIEQLLVDGGGEKAVPLESPAPGSGLLASRPVKQAEAPPGVEEDVPF